MKRVIVFAVDRNAVRLTAWAQVITTNDPTPGTREYYSKHIEGRYLYKNGAMVPVSHLQVAPRVSGVIRPTAEPKALTGTVVQVAGTNEVIVRTSRRQTWCRMVPTDAFLPRA